MLRTGIDPFVDWIPNSIPPAQAEDGPLRGVRLAVKDVIDVQGLPTGAGHPLWLETHDPAARDAEAVARLRTAGALVVGKTHTDELAYSLGGTNAHYGVPVNPAAPDRVPGGSSSGSASAVALGAADLGLGTDTAGSVRVPASYCGLYGFRPTHRRVSRTGMVPLAPSFDVPGLLARDPAVLDAGARALLEPAHSHHPANRLLVPEDLWPVVDGPVREVLQPLLDLFCSALPVDRTPLFETLPDAWQQTRAAFATVQGAEAWAAHGAWIGRERPRFGPGVTERFRVAQGITPDQARGARAVLARTAALLAGRLEGGGVLALPTAPGPAPQLGVPARPEHRLATVLLTCLASVSGAPALSVPGAVLDGAPLGLCLVAAPGADETLLDLASTHRHRRPQSSATGL
ncbi:amidase [Streptomyces sp. NPDC000880]